MHFLRLISCTDMVTEKSFFTNECRVSVTEKSFSMNESRVSVTEKSSSTNECLVSVTEKSFSTNECRLSVTGNSFSANECRVSVTDAKQHLQLYFSFIVTIIIIRKVNRNIHTNHTWESRLYVSWGLIAYYEKHNIRRN